MNCVNCKNMEICKWVEVFNEKNETLIETTNGMLGVNCSEYDDGKETGEANKLQCKCCKFNKICKFQFKLEDSTLRFKTKGCLNIECNNYTMNENYEIVDEFNDSDDEYMEQNKLDISVNIVGSVISSAELDNITNVEKGDGYITINDGHLHVYYNDNSFVDVGKMREPKLDTSVQASVYPDGKLKLNKEEESEK